MSDMIERKLEQKRKADAEKYMKEAMPSLQKGKIPETKMNESEVSDLGALVRDQAKAKKEVEKSGDVEMNVGQLRNVGEGPMVLRTNPEKKTVDAITAAAPMTTGSGGVPGKPVSGAIPHETAPQIDVNGPPPSYFDEETPDMRMKDTGQGYEQPKMTMKDALSALEKEEGPGFWDILEAAAAGWHGKTPAYAEKQAEKRSEASKIRLMERDAALNKANQLELMAKQAEIEGDRDQALAYQRAAEQQRQQANAIALLEKEYALKKGAGGGNMMEYIQQLLGGK